MARIESQEVPYLPPTFAELRAEATRGEAFTRWFRHDTPGAIRYAAARFTGGDVNAAEELVAETWKKVYRTFSKEGDTTEVANPRTYLYTSIGNAARDEARRDGRIRFESMDKVDGLSRDFAEDRHVGGAVDVEDEVIAKLHGETVQDQVADAVSPTFSALLGLDAEDYSDKEVADMTGKKLPTVRTGMHRARAQIRDKAPEIFGADTVLNHRKALTTDNPNHLPSDATVDDLEQERASHNASKPDHAAQHVPTLQDIRHAERLDTVRTMWATHTRAEIAEALNMRPNSISRLVAVLRANGEDLPSKKGSNRSSLSPSDQAETKGALSTSPEAAHAEQDTTDTIDMVNLYFAEGTDADHQLPHDEVLTAYGMEEPASPSDLTLQKKEVLDIDE